MQRVCVSLGAVLACLALVSPTAARAQDDYARNGAYVGLAGSFGIYTELDDDFGIDDVDEPLGLNARVGYRLHPHFSLEGEFEWLSDADLESDVGGDGEIESFVGTLNGKAYPLTGQIQPFAILGLGYMEVDVDGESEGDFAARLGGGVDVYVTPNLVVNLGATYVTPADDLTVFDFVSIGWG